MKPIGMTLFGRIKLPFEKRTDCDVLLYFYVLVSLRWFKTISSQPRCEGER